MRFIKLGLISIVGLLFLIMVITMLMPSSVVVSRAVDISAPVGNVYPLVYDLAKWKLWLANYDSSKATLNADTKGRQVQLKLDNTRVTIFEASPRYVKTMWQVGNAAPLPAVFEFISHERSSVTTVHWQFNQKLGWYPWERFAGMFSEKALGPLMDSSLAKLKQVAEQSK